jgi:hypothetical protein
MFPSVPESIQRPIKADHIAGHLLRILISKFSILHEVCHWESHQIGYSTARRMPTMGMKPEEYFHGVQGPSLVEQRPTTMRDGVFTRVTAQNLKAKANGSKL